MAQIKVLKINASGFQQEHDVTADEITFETFTANTKVQVSNGVEITNDIVFNAITDQIAGIENQNLLDKTVDETINADWTIPTGQKLTIIDAPVDDTDAVNKGYADQLVQGVEWQDSVKEFYDPTGGLPATPATGDRYIASATANGWTKNNIYDYDGTVWEESVAQEGFACWVDDVDTSYIFNGTAWVKMASVYNHNDTANIQGGTLTERYHLEEDEHDWVATVSDDISAGNVADLSDDETVTGNWTFTGRNVFADGELNLPDSASASPSTGDTYWDAGTDSLFVFNGTEWINSFGGSPGNKLKYIAGVGGIGQYDAVYISGSDTMLRADASANNTAKVIGICMEATSATNTGDVITEGLVEGCLNGTGAVAGDSIYLDTTAGGLTTSVPTGAGKNVVRMGFAKNPNDLQMHIQFVGIRS